MTGRAPTARDFLSRVVPWPANGIGYVNVHYSMVNARGGKDIITGKPYQDIDQLLSFCNWAETTNNIKELWYCTSLQSTCGANSKGKPKAVRLKSNVVNLKAIWVDIDVGNTPAEPDKHYHTIPEAWAAINKFRIDNQLPRFSAVVKSGGGLHVYWTSKTPLHPNAWQPFAEGLKQGLLKDGIKCDAGLTTDSARILRIPGTLNHKYNPPRLVELAHLGADYDFESDLAMLKVATVAGPLTVTVNPVLTGTPIIAFDPNDTLDAGMREPMLLELKPILAGCQFLRDALKDGGKDYANPLWNLTLLCSTFIEDGNNVAHAMSKGHKDYDQVETQRQYDRKLNERKSGLGYPSCATIRSNGCTACNICPILARSKSPLNLARVPSAAAKSLRRAGAADVQFRDLNRFGDPKPTLANAVIAIRALGIEARLDLFHSRTMVSHDGTIKTIREGLLADDTVGAVRSLINNTYKIDCGDPNTLAAIKEIARDNAFDPVLDLLDRCQGNWDGVKRLDSWVVDYLGCEDSQLNRAIGRSVLKAACRRARVPGCKFDFITVLEGPEGIDKSTAIRILAGDENFSDQSILGASDKEVQEQLEGTWMHENADLAGMKRADVEQIKAFASRQTDRARPAYGRVREDRPRRSIEWATTNDDTYLLSQTGNRRWWPLKTGRINIEALKRDREQLLGEAATYEAAGERIGLDESLWNDARDAQEQRRVTDPWEDILARRLDDDQTGLVHRAGNGLECVFSVDVLSRILDIPADKQTSQHTQRLAQAMKQVGWGRSSSGRITVRGQTLRGFVRAANSSTAPIGADDIETPQGELRQAPFSVAQRIVHAALGSTEPAPAPVETGLLRIH
jgi:predicted P-loop ATPase